jgi:hypothetical protein
MINLATQSHAQQKPLATKKKEKKKERKKKN